MKRCIGRLSQQFQGLHGSRGGKGWRRGRKAITGSGQALMFHDFFAADRNATNGPHAIFQGNGRNFNIVHESTLKQFVDTPSGRTQGSKTIGFVQNKSITKFVFQGHQFLERHNTARCPIQAFHDQESSLRIDGSFHLRIVFLNTGQDATQILHIIVFEPFQMGSTERDTGPEGFVNTFVADNQITAFAKGGNGRGTGTGSIGIQNGAIDT